MTDKPEIKRCPKGEKARITTREPLGRWCVMGYKNVSCPCGCLRTTAAYHKGGKAWQAAEAEAIALWNAAVQKQSENGNA